MPLESGTVLGGFRIVGQIGAGGMGSARGRGERAGESSHINKQRNRAHAASRRFRMNG
jgi:hypothetical protein